MKGNAPSGKVALAASRQPPAPPGVLEGKATAEVPRLICTYVFTHCLLDLTVATAGERIGTAEGKCSSRMFGREDGRAGRLAAGSVVTSAIKEVLRPKMWKKEGVGGTTSAGNRRCKIKAWQVWLKRAAGESQLYRQTCRCAVAAQATGTEWGQAAKPARMFRALERRKTLEWSQLLCSSWLKRCAAQSP